MYQNQGIRTACIAMTFLFVTPGEAGIQQKNDPPMSTSLCQVLAAPESYDGKLVRFRARFGGTWEGMYFSEPKCENKYAPGENVIMPQTVEMFEALKIEIPQSARDIKFVEDNGARDLARAEKRLCNAMQKCRYDYIEADFTGVVIVKSGFRIKDGWGNGFGQMGYTKTALVWQSVSNVVPHACKYGTGDCV